MFSCCSGLETIKLPAETEGHYFATNASNLAYMLDDCISLSKISLNGSFGANATTIHGLFG
ncbi:MAG: hypothetical protein Q4F54_04820 [Coriobacteriia bacterium]|nr:hypothetical protein [Coriobacteriia bacterium]